MRKELRNGIVLICIVGIVVASVLIYIYVRSSIKTPYDGAIEQLENIGCRIEERKIVADWYEFHGLHGSRDDVTHEEVSWGILKTRAVLIHQELGYCVVHGDRDAGVLWISSIGDQTLRELDLFPHLGEIYYFYYFIPLD